MIIPGQIFFFFWILCQSAIGDKHINIWFSQINKKPPDRDQIFAIQISTTSQCLYVCIQNKNCLTVLYNKIGLMCNGYKSQGEEDPKCGEEMIWRFVYEADRINFAMTSETSCTDSGHIDDNHGCQKVYDGTVEPQIGHEWALYTTIGNEKWIKIIFNLFVRLDQLEVWHRCTLVSQARKLELEFSNKYSLLVNGTCDGSNQYLTCTNQARFSQYNLSPEVITEWVKIKVIEMCLPQDVKHFGFIEVRTMGRFMRD